MPWTEAREVEGTVKLDGVDFPASRIITQQIDRFIEVPGRGFVEGSVWELLRTGKQKQNPAYVQIEGRWIKGHTEQKRRPAEGGRDERQTLFVADDKSLTFVVSSLPITV